MRYLNFRGIKPKDNPQDLTEGHSQVAHNIDITVGTLKSFNAPAPIGKVYADDGTILNVPAQTIYRAGDLWVGWPEFTWVAPDVQGDPGHESFLFTKNKKLYWQSAQRITQRFTPIPLGTCRATTPPTLSVIVGAGCREAAPGLDCVTPPGTPSATCVSGDVPETRGYRYSWIRDYPDCGGRMEESSPSDPEVVEVLNGDAVHAIAPPLPVGVTGVAWYRAIAGTEGSVIWLHVKDTPTRELIDNLCVNELGAPLNTDRHYPPPECVEGVAVVGDTRVVVWSGKRFWVSHPRLPHAFDTDRNEFVLLYDIVAMVGNPTQTEQATTFEAHALTTGKPYRIMGADVDKLDIREEQAWHPCLSAQSVCRIGGGTGYASPYGYVIYSGDGVVNLTDNWLLEDQWQAYKPETLKAVWWHERVWMGWADKDGAVLTISSETGMRPKSLVTHEVRVSAWYTRADVPLSLAVPSSTNVHEWGRGAPMRWSWRGPEEVQAGLWRPSTVKVVTDTPRRREDEEMAYAEFAGWTHTHNEFAPEEFFVTFPQHRHLMAQILTPARAEVSVYMDGRKWYTRPVQGSKHMRLPRSTRALEWSVAVSGTSEVREIHIQTSAMDLAQEGGMA